MSLAKPHERRQFGRLTTSYHGWIRVPGRPPVSCVVRDLSVTGAGVELVEDCHLPSHFTLTVDCVSFSGACSVRHRDGKRLGVEFMGQRAERHQARLKNSQMCPKGLRREGFR